MSATTKGRKFPVEIITPADVGKLLQACSSGPTGVRNRAIIVTLWRGGLRVSEALGLDVKDTDLQYGLLHVLHGKGDKQRQVAIDEKACSVIREWIVQRSKLVGITGSALFCTLKGERVSTSYVRALMPRLARFAGIGKRVHAHALRHAFACELLRERLPLNLIQKQLGHADLGVTSRYLQHVTPPELMEAMRGREW